MYCNKCGTHVEETSPYCHICGTVVSRNIENSPADHSPADHSPTDYSPADHSQWIPENSNPKKKKQLPLIIGITSVSFVVFFVLGFFVLKGWGDSGDIDTSQSTQPIQSTSEKKISALTETLHSDGFSLKYNPDLWKQGEVGGKKALIYEDDSAFVINDSDLLPVGFLTAVDLSETNAAINMYKVIQMSLEMKKIEGLSITGGSGTFLKLKDGVFYAKMEYKYTDGIFGAFFLVVSQEKKATAAFATIIKKADSTDEDIIAMLESLEFE